MVDHLLTNIDSAPIADRLKPVFRYVRVLTMTPARITQADVNTLYAAGWDDAAVSHAALTCAYFSFMNRWVDGLGIQADPPAVRATGDMLFRSGYRAVIDLLQK